MTDSDVAIEVRILRAWAEMGGLAAQANVRVSREDYNDTTTWFLIADLPGVGYKESMTARVVVPLAGIDDDDIRSGVDALYNQLVIAQNRSSTLGVRRGF